jgi:5-methylcytosine-specific restriction endonuclease McrA
MNFDEFCATLPTTFPPKPAKPKAKIGRPRGRKRPKTAHLRAPIEGTEYMLADPCTYCGGPANQIDHIEPLIRGGTNTADNAARACWPCNREKNTQPLLIFLARRAA